MLEWRANRKPLTYGDTVPLEGTEVYYVVMVFILDAVTIF